LRIQEFQRRQSSSFFRPIPGNARAARRPYNHRHSTELKGCAISAIRAQFCTNEKPPTPAMPPHNSLKTQPLIKNWVSFASGSHPVHPEPRRLAEDHVTMESVHSPRFSLLALLASLATRAAQSPENVQVTPDIVYATTVKGAPHPFWNQPKWAPDTITQAAAFFPDVLGH